MNRRISAAALLVVATTGCTGIGTRDTPLWIDPGQAVLRAADAPSTGVRGVFAMTVRATGRTDIVHLNSETDYRDPRNLSIEVHPDAARALERRLGGPVETVLRERRILVQGTAMRTRIDFLIDGRPSGKYYYQTHVRVTDASQIQAP